MTCALKSSTIVDSVSSGIVIKIHPNDICESWNHSSHNVINKDDATTGPGC